MGIRNLVQNQLIVRFSTLYALITLRKNMHIQLFRKNDLKMISIYSKKNFIQKLFQFIQINKTAMQ